MSYCRWSDMGCQCDVYAYEAEAGYCVHVADKRPTSPSPQLPINIILMDVSPAIKEQAMQTYRKEMDEWREDVEYVPIDHPLAGQSFGFDTEDEMREMLSKLRDDGFCLPKDEEMFDD